MPILLTYCSAAADDDFDDDDDDDDDDDYDDYDELFLWYG